MAKRDAPRTELRDISVAQLHLDARNPRLPEHVQHGDQRDLVRYMVREEALLELAESFADNAFFKHEPLLVVRRHGRDEYDVVEGNRRLATLLVLLKRPSARGVTLGVELDERTRAELQAVPCRVLKTREEVEPYVGYRHIGGMKKWPAEAKARYVVEQVEALARGGDDEPFKNLGRRVGSNARAMRHSYTALRLLRHARDEGGFPLHTLLEERRFGVWLRAYDTPKIRQYIGLEASEGEPTSYRDVQRAMKRVAVGPLVEVLQDFVPDAAGRIVMDDSREMSVYAAVLQNDRARAVMRKRRSLEEARVMVTDEALATKIERLARTAENLLHDVMSTKPDDELRAATDQLWEMAKTLRLAARRSEDDA